MSSLIESYRDPDGFVFSYKGKILRCIKSNVSDEYSKIFKKNFFKKLKHEKKIINFKIINNKFYNLNLDINKNDKIVLHKKIEFYSNPYDWPFEQLKKAAIFHLELEIFILSYGYCLKDASAKNIIFHNNKPIFIDILSFKKYDDGNYWLGQMQFYQEFLNPLMLKSYLSVDYNNWYKENYYGIFTKDLNNLLTLSKKIKPSVFFHVYLPSVLKDNYYPDKKNYTKKKFSKDKYIYFLKSLKKIIQNLVIKERSKNEWSSYDEFLPYNDSDFFKKKKIVKIFLDDPKLKNIIDFGCNDGIFLFMASNKKNLIGFDIDHQCINACYKKSINIKSNGIFFVKNLSKDIIKHTKLFPKKIDGFLALAIIHHLRVTENIPLKNIIKFFFLNAKEGIIEFIEKSDKKFTKLLNGKNDIYSDYSLDNFLLICKKLNIQITETKEIIKNTRYLIFCKSKN